MTLMRVPWARPDFGNAEKQAAIEVIKSGWVTQGKVTEEFEKGLSEYTGAKHVVCVSTGTAALTTALLAHGIGAGDEVLVPSLTFIASINSVFSVGATPILVDSDPGMWNTTPELMQEHLSDATKAIMPVDVAGMPVDVDSFERFAQEHDLALIEDAAAAIGGAYKGKPMGYFDHTSTFSFHIAKSLQTIEGGCVLTPSAEIAKRCKSIRNHGMSAPYNSKENLHYDYARYGLNFRITDIQSAIGLAQLKKVDSQVAHRNRLVALYKEALGGDYGFQEVPSYVSMHPYLFFGIMVQDTNRDSLAKFLIKHDIDIRICWLPAHRQPYHRTLFRDVSLPGADEVGNKSIELPLGGCSEEEVNHVIKVIRQFKG
ncbi:TPA: DegT/DnrJ/EryC1/StrS aminotransferase family protein [Candidatus Woesearchaeota archaeon]|nr:DegT/DnrJ/EryC1/StrS aminotransferase family protein [Candidatus Woesearchaeota archaeon]HII68361.1 DegT/DnrJ/EryC1/StrS aminotransferase family protein [Candidatus Woesearchaeota archaeon]